MKTPPIIDNITTSFRECRDYFRTHTIKEIAGRVATKARDIFLIVAATTLCISFAGTSVFAFWGGFVLYNQIHPHVDRAIKSLKFFRAPLALVGAVAVAICVFYFGLAHFLGLPVILNMVAFSVALYAGMKFRAAAEKKLQAHEEQENRKEALRLANADAAVKTV